MIKKIATASALLLLTCLGNIMANTVTAVKVGVHNNPPLCSIDSIDGAQGIFIDLIDDIASTNNWVVEYIPLTLSEGLSQLQYGSIDLLTNVAITKEREQLYLFGDENIFTNWGVVYCSPKSNIESIADLRGKTIGLEREDIHAKALIKLLNDFNIKANIIWYESPGEIFSNIENGNVEAGAVNKLFGYQHNLTQKLKTTSILFNPVNVRFAGSPVSQPLLNDIDEALVVMKAERPEYYHDVVNQWLVKEVDDAPRWIVNLLYILFAISIVLFVILLVQRGVLKRNTKSLEEEKRQGDIKEKTIRQLEGEKTLILNSLDEQVVFMDTDYRLVWANDAFKKANDKPFDELVGQKCYKVYFNREKPCEFCRFETCLTTNRTEVREHVSEQSGKVFIHKTHPVFDADLKPIGFVEILSDISEKKRYEDQLIEAKEKAEQSDYLKSAFLANMSHEIRTPMNAIIGFSELLEDTTLSDADKNNYLRIIQSNGHQLLKLISDILVFSQIEAGYIEMQYASINVCDFLEDIYQQIKRDAKKHNKRLEIILDVSAIDNEQVFDSDPVRIKQVLTNMLTNAVKFTEEGSVTIKALLKDNDILISVTDTGIGIPKSKHELVFKRFSQVENNRVRKSAGSGLGLTIANDLIKQLNGVIELESEVGKGSTFRIVHPLKRKPAIQSPVIDGQLSLIKEKLN